MTIQEIEEILLVISEKDSSKDSAKTAFTSLYKGYSQFLNMVISSVLKGMGIFDEHLLNTVRNNTFFLLYENPLVFSFPEKASDDKSFKAWLSIVAKNELKRLIGEYFENTTSLEIVNTEPIIESEELSDEVFESVNLKTMNNALDMLSERDRNIIWTLYLYYEEGKKTPSDVLNMLCKLHDTTKPNIRKIKERGEKVIIEYFSKNSQLKPLKYVKQ